MIRWALVFMAAAVVGCRSAPSFRGANIRCAPADGTAESLVRTLISFASDSTPDLAPLYAQLRDSLRLPVARPGDIAPVRDDATCRRAVVEFEAREPPAAPHAIRSVYVARYVDRSVVVVKYDPEPRRMSEWRTAMIFDRRWRLVASFGF